MRKNLFTYLFIHLYKCDLIKSYFIHLGIALYYHYSFECLNCPRHGQWEPLQDGFCVLWHIFIAGDHCLAFWREVSIKYLVLRLLQLLKEPPKALVPFNGKKHLETNIWTLSIIAAAGVSLFRGPLRWQCVGGAGGVSVHTFYIHIHVSLYILKTMSSHQYLQFQFNITGFDRMELFFSLLFGRNCFKAIWA